MKGFKDSTRMKYMCGGPVKKAVGGSVNKPMQSKPPQPPTKGTAKGTAKVGNPVTKGPGQPPQPPTKGNPDIVWDKGRKPPVTTTRQPLLPSTKGTSDISRDIGRMPPATTTRPTPVAPVEPVTRRPTITSGGTPEEPGYSKDGSAKKGVPAHNSRPMIGRKAGGLAVMPKGKCK